ncbi:MAG TPA: cytochrome P450 [Polyangiales bacterium]|nr:cytochrome P450 [Polyangiales bacterium]
MDLRVAPATHARSKRTVSAAEARVQTLPPRPGTEVRSLAPGSDGLPLLGDLLAFVRDARGLCQRMHAKHGPNFRLKILGAPMLVIGQPDLIREVLLDHEHEYSNRIGWHLAIGELFGGGLMLRDFEEHREHRQIMQAAFRPQALAGYLERLNPIVGRALAGWKGRVEAYAAVKQLSLDIAVEVFLGISLGDEARRINRAFVDMVAASVAPVRLEVPGLAYHRGMKARRMLVDYFARLIPERRRTGGTDLLSQLCQAATDDGARFSDEEIIDHIIFLLMAAHDTTASSLSALLWALAQHPEWQARLGTAMRARSEPTLGWTMRDEFEDFDLCFNEALRMFPPVAFFGRRVTCDTRLGELRLPRNTSVAPAPLVAHYLPEYWTEPERFDPERFAPQRAEHRRHTHSYLPFGGGAHTCIGMGFARLEVRAVLYQLLRRFELRLPDNYRLDMQSVPIGKPRGGLPLILRPQSSQR